VEALCLVNCVSTQAGWIEWGYQKLNARHLRNKGMTQAVLDYLMWHHFGRVNITLHTAFKWFRAVLWGLTSSVSGK
jgi:Ndr family.